MFTTETTEKNSRRAWIEGAKATLDRWDDTLAEIEAKVESSRDDVRADLRARLEAARTKAADAKKKWEAVRDETGDVLDSVREEVSTAWDANKTAMERSLEEIRSALR